MKICDRSASSDSPPSLPVSCNPEVVIFAPAGRAAGSLELESKRRFPCVSSSVPSGESSSPCAEQTDNPPDSVPADPRLVVDNRWKVRYTTRHTANPARWRTFPHLCPNSFGELISARSHPVVPRRFGWGIAKLPSSMIAVRSMRSRIPVPTGGSPCTREPWRMRCLPARTTRSALIYGRGMRWIMGSRESGATASRSGRIRFWVEIP